MRAAIDSYDWGSTPLGPRETWPQTLRTILGVVLDSPFPMLVMWGDDLIQLYNDAFVPIYVDKHPRSLGQPASECWKEIWSEVGPLLRRVYDAGESVFVENMPLSIVRHGSPEPAFFTYSYSPIREGDRIGGLICIVNETTAHVLRERDSVERAEALTQLDRAKTEFFSNISHEFRTPLTLMLGPLEELVRTLPDYEQRQTADLARRNAVRLQRLVNTLLDFSGLQNGMVKPRREPVDVDLLTADLASEFRSAYERAGLYLSVETHAGATAPIDRPMYEKIVLNLLSNALKFTFEGGVTVTTARDANDVVLSVSDTGIGIAEEDRTRLFQRFSRISGTRSRTHEGSGIGLALVHELVALHGGNIEVQSEPGAGSRFIARFPLSVAADAAPASNDTRELRRQFLEEVEAYAPAPAPAPAPEPASSPRSASHRHILIADDNADLRRYLGRLLSTRYTVSYAADGDELLQLSAATRFDLIIADVMMPNMDGLQALRALRERPETASTPVILLSARAGDEASVEGLEHGADDYIVKPFVAADLLARVDALLRRTPRIDGAARLRRERREMALLAAAADRFIAATDTATVWETVTSVLAPGFADWCIVYERKSDRTFPSVSASHADPAKAALSFALSREAPFKLGDGSAISRAAQEMKPLLVSAVTPNVLVTGGSFERAAVIEAVGIHSFLCAPVIVDGEAIAVIDVARSENEEPLTAEDLEFLRTFAARSSLAFRNARAQERERTIASTLQRALLPAALPSMPGITFSASYSPAAHESLVGGDWYDAFAIEGRRVVVSIGDVVGHGLQSATVMAKLRQGVRGFALEHDDPAAILFSLNRLLVSEDPGRLATAYVAIVDTQTLDISVASAGHYPALCVNAAGESIALGAEGLILGAEKSSRYATRHYTLQPGDLVALFTDGFIENDRNIETGERRFVRALAKAYDAPDPASAVHLSMFGKQPPNDDAALITLYAHQTITSLALRLIAEPASAARSRVALRRFLASLPLAPERQTDILYAAGEAVVNVIEHAYPENACGALRIFASFDGTTATIDIEDDGGAWDLEAPDSTQRGYGLPLMHAFCDGVDIERSSNGTRVRITTKLDSFQPH